LAVLLLAKDRLLLLLLRLRESNERDDDRTRDKAEAATDFDVFEEAVAIEGAKEEDDEAPRDGFCDLSCAATGPSLLLRETNEEGNAGATDATSTPSWVEVIADDSGSCNNEDADDDDDDSPSCS